MVDSTINIYYNVFALIGLSKVLYCWQNHVFYVDPVVTATVGSPSQNACTTATRL